MDSFTESFAVNVSEPIIEAVKSFFTSKLYSVFTPALLIVNLYFPPLLDHSDAFTSYFLPCTQFSIIFALLLNTGSVVIIKLANFPFSIEPTWS